MRTTRILAGALTSVGIAAAGLGLVTGTAAAMPSSQHTWCPGQSMDTPHGPGRNYVWDMNVCHTWQYVKGGMGNVQMLSATGYDPVTFQPTGWTTKLDGSNLWDGPERTGPPDRAKLTYMNLSAVGKTHLEPPTRHTFVGRLRPPPPSRSLETNTSERTYTTKHGTVSTMKTSAIDTEIVIFISRPAAAILARS